VTGCSQQWLTSQPAAPLSPFVDRYVGYRLVGFAPGFHHGLPSSHMTFIVSIGADIDVAAQTDRSQIPDRYRCVVSGLQASSALIVHDGNQEGIAIELSPLGSRAVFGMPAGALWNTSVELSDVVGSIGSELWERLQSTGTWHDRFAVCDEVLTGLLRDNPVAPELQRSWQLLVASAGSIPVSDLALEIEWSRQHLARRFGHEFGLSPKLAGRVVRFERARRMLGAAPSTASIARVAATCGYYDQAHLTRDFVELAGCPPRRLFADDLPSFQDTAGTDWSP
jgi:AraC-like DNA-binding protein